MHEEPERNVVAGENAGVIEVWTLEVALYDSRRVVVDFNTMEEAQEHAQQILRVGRETIAVMDAAKNAGRNFRVEE